MCVSLCVCICVVNMKAKQNYKIENFTDKSKVISPYPNLVLSVHKKCGIESLSQKGLKRKVYIDLRKVKG